MIKTFEYYEGSNALREVKRLANEMDTHDKIGLAYNDYRETFYVTDDLDELSELMHQKWCDSGCDNEPNDEAKEYKVWIYVLAEKKKSYPSTYRNYKRSLIKADSPLVRLKTEVECEYSVSFIID